MKLPVQMNVRNMERSLAVEELVREKAAKLDQFFDWTWAAGAATSGKVMKIHQRSVEDATRIFHEEPDGLSAGC